MQSFLNLVAKHILGNHASLERINVVVPTRRAAFFLMQELAKETTEALMSPRVIAVDDFVEGIENFGRYIQPLMKTRQHIGTEQKEVA